ncbi:MAG TPA: phospho-sugar mutase [Clostridia bacterium]|nr:phospho-sugar mutase [Clostridia bacterium]
MNILDTYRLWCEQATLDADVAKELQQIKGASYEIEDRFYRELEFGTGGLRGIIGAGTNRMNVHTVAKATQGYSQYINAMFTEPKVAIAYDSRIKSDRFAVVAAEVFAGNGIHAWLYPQIMPTPSLSFAVRDIGCCGGIVITASHNPAKYNGYKVYGPDGCQITTESAAEIQQKINAVDPFTDVKRIPFEAGKERGLIRMIGEATIRRYLDAVAGASVLPKNIDRGVSIVYTPLNGAGINCVPRSLTENGFTKIVIPDEQREPDGNFPTCPFPNPEVREALEVGLKWAAQTNSELLLATDPDCDRVGAAVRDKEDYTLINGNEMGVLLLDFICRMRVEAGTMPKRPAAVKTIVTTPMAKRVAAHYDVELIDVLTGFKFIGEQIGLLESKREESRYIFGFEESYGYLSGSFVRDKDAVNASLLICEMVAYYKYLGKSLLDVLNSLYQQFGYYQSRLLSFTFEGSTGFAKMSGLLASLRETKPAEIAGLAVEAVADYQLSIRTGAGGEQETIYLPKSNVLRFFLAGGSEAVVRPSGTEPKLKIYLAVTADSKETCGRQLDDLESDLSEIVYRKQESNQ